MGEKQIKKNGIKCNTLDSSPVHLRTSAGPPSTFWALCDPRNSCVHRHTWSAPGTWGPFWHFKRNTKPNHQSDLQRSHWTLSILSVPFTNLLDQTSRVS